MFSNTILSNYGIADLDTWRIKMDYLEFVAEYEKNFSEMFKYTPDQVGSQIFAEKLAILADEYPDFESKLLGE